MRTFENVWMAQCTNGVIIGTFINPGEIPEFVKTWFGDCDYYVTKYEKTDDQYTVSIGVDL